MKILTTLLLALCILGQAQAVEANTTSIENYSSTYLNVDFYSVPEGLSQSTVTTLLEDKSSYVWIGTLNGLNLFDGESFKHYLSSNEKGTLPSSFIRSIHETSGGKILIGTDKGLAVYHEKFDSFEAKVELGNSPIWSIAEYNNELYIGTENKVLVSDMNFNKKRILTNDFGGIKKIIPYGNHLFVRNFFGEVFTISNSDEIKSVESNSSDIFTFNNKLYLLKNDGIYENINSLFKKVSTDKFDSIFKSENSLHAISNNTIFTLDESLFKTQIGIIDIENMPLTKPSIVRGESKTYITTQNIGFIEIDNFKNIITKYGNIKGNIWSLFEISDSELMTSTDSKFIKIQNFNNNNLEMYNSGVEGAKQSIFLKGKIFVATLDGIIVIDRKTKERKKIFENSFFAIQLGRDGNYIYAGTTDGKLVSIDSMTLETVETIVDTSNPIFDIEESDSGLWVATQGGMFNINNNKVSKVHNELVISLHAKDNLVYFGTENSLLSFSEKTKLKSTVYSKNRPIYSIISSDKLIYSASIKSIAVTDTKSNTTTFLSTVNGSQAEYNAQAIASNQKSILLGGISGISSITKSDLEKELYKRSLPKVSLSELLIFNIPEPIGSGILKSKLSLSNEITLKYSDYPFTIKFNTPGKSSNNISYSYQLSGLSDVWVESKGINSATYTNLSPGDYTFNVFAKDPLTNKDGKIKSININITPPWWLSKQAKLIYFMLALIISAVIVKAILRRREVQNQIAKSEERLKLSLWGSGDEMWDWDIETGQIYRSNIWGSLEFPRDGQRSGETGEESNIHPMDQERVSSALNDHFYGKKDHFEAAYRVKGKSDNWVWILDRAKIVERDEKDNPLRMTGTIKNINNFKHAEEQLRLFERAIANISEGMFILDSEFRFVEVNEACCELCLNPREKFIGEQFNFDLYPDSYSAQIRSILNQQGRWSNDVESAKGDGTSFLMELTVDAIYDDQGQLSHYVGVFSDISRRKQQEEELRKLTNNDLLTNLPNRSSLMVTLGNLVKRDSHHTLMVLDLDNFKKINDSLGHQIGDELLIMVAKRIETAVPYHTSIYRLGGDEFAILVDNNPDIGSSAVIANNVIEAFATPFELTSDKVVVGMSIGIVLYPEDDQNEQALLRKADIAMYHAKSGGGNRYQFYSESLNRNAIRQLEVENLIRLGIKEDLFEVYYQPKIDLKTGKMAGMEALVRLNHPEHGLIPPSEFIPLAEENGLIVEIGDIVMKKACFAAQNWRSQGIFDGRVAVNLSSYQFALPDLQQRIESILRLTQLPAANLELEITEGTVIKQPEKAIKVMQQLSKMGVSLALDDFGTGYSSLSYLKRFPIHTLKIDKAFVDDIDKSDRDLKMVDSIITIAHNMGLSVVGEGVEDASQLSILKALNCEEIQGFIFSKAVTESQFTDLLNKEFIEPDLVQSGQKAI